MRAPAAPSRPAIAAGVATKRGLINANVARRVSVRGASTDDKNGVAPSQIPSMYNLFGGPAKDKEFGNSLEDRIASGEFSDNGSTKEKLTRPIRKILAQDPIGAGKWMSYFFLMYNGYASPPASPYAGAAVTLRCCAHDACIWQCSLY